MAKSKLLTAAVMSSALVLVACGGNTQDEDTSATTSTTGTSTEAPAVELVIEDEEPMVIEEPAVDTEVMIEEVDPMAGLDMDLFDQRLVFFDFDKSVIRPEARAMLDVHAQYLVANPTQMVVLEGHADERGTREYNMGLGERRANQVKVYLQVKGVSASQLDVVSYGEERALALGKTEADYQMNRRVELVYK